MLYANSIVASSMDKEMIDILASLAEESSQPPSQTTALSQSVILDQGRIMKSVGYSPGTRTNEWLMLNVRAISAKINY